MPPEPDSLSDLEEVVEQANESVAEAVSADDVLLEEVLEPPPLESEPASEPPTKAPTKAESAAQEPFAQDEPPDEPPPSEPVSQDDEVATSAYAEELPPDFWDSAPAAPPDPRAPKPAPPPERYNPDAPLSEQLRQLFPGKVVRTEPAEAEKPVEEEFEDAVQEGLFD